MFADLVEQLLRFHSCGSEETIKHIIGVLRLAEKASQPLVVVDEQAERRRERDRERKRAVRASTCDQAGLSADDAGLSADTVSPLLPPYNNNNPLITPLSSKKQKPQALPLDWKPKSEHCELAGQLGLGEPRLAIEAARMQAWAASKGEMRTDWDAFFTYWLRNGAPKAFKGLAASEKVVRLHAPCRALVFVAEGTPQWDAWLAAGHKKALKVHVRGNAGWNFESEWPPQEAMKA